MSDRNFGNKDTARSRAVVAISKNMDWICDHIDHQIKKEKEERRYKHRIGVLYPTNK